MFESDHFPWSNIRKQSCRVVMKTWSIFCIYVISLCYSFLMPDSMKKALFCKILWLSAAASRVTTTECDFCRLLMLCSARWLVLIGVTNTTWNLWLWNVSEPESENRTWMQKQANVYTRLYQEEIIYMLHFALPLTFITLIALGILKITVNSTYN